MGDPPAASSPPLDSGRASSRPQGASASLLQWLLRDRGSLRRGSIYSRPRVLPCPPCLTKFERFLPGLAIDRAQRTVCSLDFSERDAVHLRQPALYLRQRQVGVQDQGLSNLVVGDGERLGLLPIIDDLGLQQLGQPMA